MINHAMMPGLALLLCLSVPGALAADWVPVVSSIPVPDDALYDQVVTKNFLTSDPAGDI